jgi:hypothetical protein
VTSDQWGASPPSPPALCGHPRCCATILSTAAPSLTLWEPGMTRHRHPRRCASFGLPSATPSNQHTDDDPSGRCPLSHPRSRDETTEANLFHPRSLGLGFDWGVSSSLTSNDFKFDCDSMFQVAKGARRKGNLLID